MFYKLRQSVILSIVESSVLLTDVMSPDQAQSAVKTTGPMNDILELFGDNRFDSGPRPSSFRLKR